MALTTKQLRELNERYQTKSDFIKRATVDTIQKESSAEQETRIKHLLKPQNYGEMFSYYFGKDTPIPMADCECAWYHTTIYRDLYDNAFNTLFNLIHRGGAKSTHGNMGYPFALKQSEKAKFFLTVGQNEERAAMLLQDLQVQFEHNKRIIADFGQQKVYGSWADGTFETTDRSTFMSLGIDQPFRGLRANGVRLEYASIDDIEDKKRAQNKALTREYVEKVTADIQGAFSTKSERTIINNNYFVKDGFIEMLAKKKGFDLKKLNTKENQVIRNEFASLYLINLTSKYFDQVTVENVNEWEPSWPERFPKSACLRKISQYTHDKETLSGEFYNTPINVGKKIKEGMIKMVKPLPLSDYLIMIENWDLAYSSEACHKAKAMIGVANGRMTVLDIFCRQTDVSVAMAYHFKQAKKHMKLNSALISYYDASVAQEAVYEPQWLFAALKHKSFHLPLPQKSTIDKYIKIDTTLVTTLLSGNLDFSEELENNPDWEEAKNQMLNFEKGGKYPVDFPDSLSDTILKAQEYLDYSEEESEDNKDSLRNKPIIGKKTRGGY